MWRNHSSQCRLQCVGAWGLQENPRAWLPQPRETLHNRVGALAVLKVSHHGEPQIPDHWHCPAGSSAHRSECGARDQPGDCVHKAGRCHDSGGHRKDPLQKRPGAVTALTPSKGDPTTVRGSQGRCISVELRRRFLETYFKPCLFITPHSLPTDWVQADTQLNGVRGEAGVKSLTAQGLKSAQGEKQGEASTPTLPPSA